MGWPGRGLTHRQHDAWLAWRAYRRTIPEPVELLLQQMTAVIYNLPWRVWGEEPPPEITPDTFRLRTKDPEPDAVKDAAAGALQEPAAKDMKLMPMGLPMTEEDKELVRQSLHFAHLGMALPPKLEKRLQKRLERERRWAAGEDV